MSLSSGDESPAVPAMQAGRAALARGSWNEARAHFEAAVAVEDTAAALEGLSWAAWWQNDAAALFAARESAYARFRAQGDLRGAARMAGWLANDHADFRGEHAVAVGWIARARRMLEGLEVSAEHGWVDLHEAEHGLLSGDLDSALSLARGAASIGRELRLVDLEMTALAAEGLVLAITGSAQEGLRRLDEAAAAALAGEFTELAPMAWCGCNLIFACDLLRDYNRAEQWCRAFEAWSHRMGVTFANRLCRVVHAGVLCSRGIWQRAEDELLACADLSELRPPMAVEATVRLAELRRRQGRFEEAETLFDAVGGEPAALLGLGELRLDRGDPAGACDRAREYLRVVPDAASTLRAPGLSLLVRGAAALGEQAKEALVELEAIAEATSIESLLAAARHARGVFAAAAGKADVARAALEDAVRLYKRTGNPYESAATRLALSEQLRLQGREQAARREIASASAALTDLGAQAGITRAQALLDTSAEPFGPDSPLAALTRREREVLVLVAEGLSNGEIGARLFISEHTVKRHVANILKRLDLPSRAAAASLAGRHGLR